MPDPKTATVSAYDGHAHRHGTAELPEQARETWLDVWAVQG